jgi:hypothetical protein
MVRDLIRKLQKLRVEAVPFDPSTLGDEVATKTSWGPAKGGGASFQTHRLVEIDPHRTEFRAVPGAIAFYGVFMAIGLGVTTIMFFANQGSSSGSSLAGMILPLMFGLLFAGIGGTMMYFGLAPIVFDKRRGEYWKGRTAPYEAANREGMKHYAKLSGVRALQIIRERCTSKNSSYFSYELNLVLDDGSRLNVVDHGNLTRLREDADRLAAFLGKPVWDGTEGAGDR